MPFYLYQLAYSPEAIKAMVAKPSDRKAAATQLICFLATLYPASRARRLQVIEGLRYT